MPSADRILLDTHAVLWWKAGGDRLSPTAARRLRSASRILISPISCWEIAMLVGKHRVLLDRPVPVWVADVLAADEVELAPLTPPIAVAAAQLVDFHGDPADRFLVATAAAEGVPLMSKDRLIRDHARASGGIEVLW